jgi:hypothetical protein
MKQDGEPVFGHEIDKYRYVVYTIPDKLEEGVYSCELYYANEYVVTGTLDEEDLECAIWNKNYPFGMLAWQYGIGRAY